MGGNPSERWVRPLRDPLAGFKEFLMRGNVVELAVAVVVGTAFTKIVDSVVKGVINPIIGAMGSKDLERYRSCLRGPCHVTAQGEVDKGIYILWGQVISATLTFLLTAAVVYFLMILPMNHFNEIRKRKLARPAEATPAQPTELELLTEIRDLLAQGRAGVLPGDQAVAGLIPRPDRGPAAQRESTQE
ncbi:mechanosensitive ion channel protein [Wenjunlia vitaminophila]|uniref:Large-conductance mechanosensitive channel n=1 Tax=Wenjunlia vitaminophila TaxID=76728 RepID=A0A0T6LV65_WENVI|nr:large conductance mechanosensitive channel protein MscL [Wenjunlia vitaminophila]KRV50014.1 mechanosensitive ion channel protein [Wenjunlia vitaminophila]